MANRSPSPSAPDFAQPVRDALLGARREAVRLRHPYVLPDHLLLGLLRLDEQRVRRIWATLGVKPATLAGTQEGALRPGAERHAIDDPNALPFTSRGRWVVERMVREAVAAGQLVVQPEHLLLAIVLEERGMAGQICRDAGITAERVRTVALELAPPPDRAELIELDDRSDRPIGEQIVRRIQEQVATSALSPGQQLPPIRRLADRLDIAPGTVARAYAELERLGVVVTDGARGTRVAERRPPADPDAPPPEELLHLLRPAVITAFHMGASASHLRATLEAAMHDIFGDGSAGLS